MAYSVVFINAPVDLPPDLQARVRLILDEVGEVCSEIPLHESFWTYIQESGFVLDREGWRFYYRLDRPQRQLVVDRCVRVVKDLGPSGSADADKEQSG